MISLPNVVKSFAVVDNREGGDDSEKRADARFIEGAVIKSGTLNNPDISFKHSNAPLPRDAYLEEINRLRIKIEEAKAELKIILREIEDARKHNAKLGLDDDADLLDEELYQARKQEIRDYIGEAEKQAEKARIDAEAAAEEITRQARESGYREGFIQGSEEASAAVRQDAELKLEELAVIIEDLSAYGEELMRRKENEFVELVIAVARKVIAREIKTDPKYIIDMLRDFLTRNHRETYINLSLSPDMASPKVKTNDEVLAKLTEIARNLSLYIEKEAGEGTMILETPKGVTDMSIGTQLRNMEEQLMSEEQPKDT